MKLSNSLGTALYSALLCLNACDTPRATPDDDGSSRRAEPPRAGSTVSVGPAASATAARELAQLNASAAPATPAADTDSAMEGEVVVAAADEAEDKMFGLSLKGSDLSPPPADMFVGTDEAYDLPLDDLMLKGTLGGAPHSSVEPEHFSAGWIGQESADVLKRARRGEFPFRTVGTSYGQCTLFEDQGTIRRMILARSGSQAELSFSSRGDLILWFRTNPNEPNREWAYFHRGQNLMLYQQQNGQSWNTPRLHPPAPHGLRELILGGSADCITRAGARNPLPGAAPLPSVVPPPVAPPPVAPASAQPTHVHGAFALSQSTGKWGVGSRRLSSGDANQGALGYCAAPDCELKMSFGQGMCVAVAHGSDGYRAWSRRAGYAEARASVLQYCQQKGRHCSIRGTFCND